MVKYSIIDIIYIKEMPLLDATGFTSYAVVDPRENVRMLAHAQGGIS